MPGPDLDDNRLDELNRKVNRLDAHINALARDMDKRIGSVNARITSLRNDADRRIDFLRGSTSERIDAVHDRINSTRRAR